MATLFHCNSTDSDTQHGACPDGINSWCFYNKAIAERRTPQSHNIMSVRLSASIVEKIIPIYERLSSYDQFMRCVRAKTQNVNESLHSLIWRKCPKEVFVSKKRIEIAVANAVSEFNNGIVKTQLMKAALSNTDPSSSMMAYARRKDQSRLHSQSDGAKEKRRVSRNKKKFEQPSESSLRKEEGVLYGAGKF